MGPRPSVLGATRPSWCSPSLSGAALLPASSRARRGTGMSLLFAVRSVEDPGWALTILRKNFACVGVVFANSFFAVQGSRSRAGIARGCGLRGGGTWYEYSAAGSCRVRVSVNLKLGRSLFRLEAFSTLWILHVGGLLFLLLCMFKLLGLVRDSAAPPDGAKDTRSRSPGSEDPDPGAVSRAVLVLDQRVPTLRRALNTPRNPAEHQRRGSCRRWEAPAAEARLHRGFKLF